MILIPAVSDKATPAQQRALMRLPRSAREIKADTRRRALWARVVHLGLAEWRLEVLVRTSAGDRAIARLTGMVDRAYDRFMARRRAAGARK